MNLTQALSAVKKAKASLEQLEANRDKIKKTAKIILIALGACTLSAGIFLLVKTIRKKKAAKAVEAKPETAPETEAETEAALVAEAEATEEEPVIYEDFTTTVAELEKKVGGLDA